MAADSNHSLNDNRNLNFGAKKCSYFANEFPDEIRHCLIFVVVKVRCSIAQSYVRQNEEVSNSDR